MKDRVFMTKAGELCAARPIFFSHGYQSTIVAGFGLTEKLLEHVGWALFGGEKCLGFIGLMRLDLFGLTDLGEL